MRNMENINTCAWEVTEQNSLKFGDIELDETNSDVSHATACLFVESIGTILIRF